MRMDIQTRRRQNSVSIQAEFSSKAIGHICDAVWRAGEIWNKNKPAPWTGFQFGVMVNVVREITSKQLGMVGSRQSKMKSIRKKLIANPIQGVHAGALALILGQPLLQNHTTLQMSTRMHAIILVVYTISPIQIIVLFVDDSFYPNQLLKGLIQRVRKSSFQLLRWSQENFSWTFTGQLE